MNLTKVMIVTTTVLVSLALIPPMLIAQARAVNSKEPRIHYIQDMDNQPKFRAQHPNPLFLDGRAMRPPVQGTVARGHLKDDDHLYLGVVHGKFAETFPDALPVTRAMIERGRARFNIYCQPCHGLAGYGDGMISERAMELVNQGTNGTTWVEPKSLHEAAIVDQPVGQIFNSITNGVRTMPSYRSQIPVADRWAIVSYVRALQRSQDAKPTDLTAQERAGTGGRG